MGRRILTGLIAALLLLVACAPKHGTTLCVNPLTGTDIPDNDVIRVGDTYYMVSTTMYFCPGAPIMKSKDLVHWQIVSYIYDFLEDDDIYNLRDGGRHAYGRGQWATTLRYVDGVYYALFIANDQRKTYVFRTKDIESSYWERNVIDLAMHDASLLFEDGRVYCVWGNGDLRITELEPDLSAVKDGGVDQVLISSPREGVNLRAEGAHVYHIGDYYYVLEISWPRGGVRTETCWRSKDLLGEYESKVVLQGAFDGRGDGVAQGAIFDTQFGDWYAVMFQDHGAVGRIPTLQPVTWVDGWPMMGDNGVPVKEFEVQLDECGEDYVWASDEFEYQDNKDLALVWQWNHKPLDGCWSVTERPGWLRLTTGQLAERIADARNTLTQRTVTPGCYSLTRMDASAMKPGDHAGLCAFQSNFCALEVQVADDGKKELVAIDRNGDILRTQMRGDIAYLRIDYDFTTDTARMQYSFDDMTWIPVDYELKMRYTLDYFTGYRSALYNYATKELGGAADFDYFRQEEI